MCVCVCVYQVSTGFLLSSGWGRSSSGCHSRWGRGLGLLQVSSQEMGRKGIRSSNRATALRYKQSCKEGDRPERLMKWRRHFSITCFNWSVITTVNDKNPSLASLYSGCGWLWYRSICVSLFPGFKERTRWWQSTLLHFGSVTWAVIEKANSQQLSWSSIRAGSKKVRVLHSLSKVNLISQWGLWDACYWPSLTSKLMLTILSTIRTKHVTRYSSIRCDCCSPSAVIQCVITCT